MNDRRDPMADIKDSFFVECEELLESLADELQALEIGTSDKETLDTIFRAVHSIKGGAGAFGFDGLVLFAHGFESVLDALRSGMIDLDTHVLQLFFMCSDLLADHVQAAFTNIPIEDTVSTPVLEALDALAITTDSGWAADHSIDFVPQKAALFLDDVATPNEETCDEAERQKYLIYFRPNDSLFRTGNEPLFLIRALAKLGNTKITCSAADLPDLDEINAASGYLAWTILLSTICEIDHIQDVFDFVDGHCAITIETRGTAESWPSIPARVAVAPNTGLGQVSENATEPESSQTSPAVEETKSRSTTDFTPLKTAQVETPRQTVRVDIERADGLVNLVGELVINQAMLAQSAVEAGISPNSKIAQRLEEFMQLTRDIQESVMMIRAQPVKSLFHRMSRVVRETSDEVGKIVHFKTDGVATEVDKVVIERLLDPLSHMVRNAVDHSLETPTERISAGKPEAGILTLTAEHKSGRVILELSDDGRGLDRDQILQTAIQKGLVSESAVMTPVEIDNLLFAPGFSTKKSVSKISGRGVGLDVVRTAIQSLGGRISIHSKPGSGTTFKISLPLTLAVLDGMVIRVAGQTLVVPLSSIQETLTIDDNCIKELGPDSRVIQVRKEYFPLLDLGDALGFRKPNMDVSGDIALLIAREDGSHIALAIDGIQEQRQVVIKGLQPGYGRVSGIAAATILGDGQVALIVDPTEINLKSSASAACQLLDPKVCNV